MSEIPIIGQRPAAPQHQAPNPYENTARERKAYAIAKVLRDWSFQRSQVRSMQPVHRLMAARAAHVAGRDGQRVPSAETWARVLELL